MNEDLSLVVDVDASGLASGMDAVRQEIDATVTHIHKQEDSWLQLAATSITAVSGIVNITRNVVEIQRALATATIFSGAATVGYASAQKQAAAATITAGTANAIATPPTLSLAAAVNFLLSPVVLATAAVAVLSGAIYYFLAATEAGADATAKLSKATDETKESASAASSIWDSFMAGFVGTEGLDAFSELSDAATEFMDALSELADVALEPLRAMGFNVGSIASMFLNLTENIRFAAGVLKTITDGMSEFSQSARTAFASFGMFAAAASGTEAYEAQRAMNFAVEESANLIDNATAEAEKRAEIERIGKLVTLDALDAEANGLREHIALMREKGKYNKAEQEDAKAKAKAIADQRVAVENGTAKGPEKKESAIDAMIKRAQDDVAALRFGADEANLMKLELGGEDPAKIATLRQELELKQTLKQIEQDRKKAEQEAQQAAEKQKQLQEQGEARITSLRDQLDLLNGTATKTDIALREMSRQGFSADQIEEARILSEQIAELENKKGSSGKTAAAFAAMNSKEAYSSILNATQGDKTPERETAKNTARMAKLMEQANRNGDTRNVGPTLNNLNEA